MTGLEIPLIELFKASIAGVVFKTCWDEGKSFIPWVGRGLNKNTKELIYRALGQYAENYWKRHCILKVLGMREPVSLESIYTAVQLLSETDIREFQTTEALEATYRKSNNQRFYFETEKQDGITIAEQKQYLTILGAPGSGKSTFLRKIGLEALKGKKGNYQHSCIPVFIELKKLTEAEIDLEKIIAEEFEVCNFPQADKNTTKLLEKGKLLILLDGLDEVPTKNLNNAIDRIQDFVDNNQIKDLVTKHLTDPRWKEVFLLVAGLMNRGADELLLLMEKEAQNYLDTITGKQKLIPLLRWADEVTKGSQGDLKPVAKRANALANANALHKMIEYVCELKKLPEIFQNLDYDTLITQLQELQTKLPDQNQPEEIHREFAQRIINTLLQAFHLSPELLNLSQEECEEIDKQYFYINWLMVQCKEAALRLSPQTWSGIDERMLLCPDKLTQISN